MAEELGAQTAPRSYLCARHNYLYVAQRKVEVVCGGGGAGEGIQATRRESRRHDSRSFT